MLETLRVHALASTEVAVSGPNGARVERCEARVRERNDWRSIEAPDALFGPPQTSGARYIDPASRAAVAAVRALKSHVPLVSAERLGCILVTRGGNAYSVALYETTRLSGKRAGPLLFAHAGWNVPVALAAAELGCRGFTATLCAGDKSGAKVLQYARDVLTHGRADVLIAGTVDLKPITQSDSADPSIEASSLLCILGLAQAERGDTMISVDDLRRIFGCY
jgi:3-oxoacyl-(acyl-carrier-protein) synthase